MLIRHYQLIYILINVAYKKHILSGLCKSSTSPASPNFINHALSFRPSNRQELFPKLPNASIPINGTITHTNQSSIRNYDEQSLFTGLHNYDRTRNSYASNDFNKTNSRNNTEKPPDYDETLINRQIINNKKLRDEEQENFKNSWLEGVREEEIDNAHRTDSLSIFLLMSMLIISVIIVWNLHVKHVNIIHETGVSLILGISVGFVVRMSLIWYSEGEFSNIANNSLTTESSATNNNDSLMDLLTVHLMNATDLLIAPSRLIMNISDNEYVYSLDGQYNINKNLTKQAEKIEEKSSFNPEVFFYVLLPPIVFFAGYQLQRNYFFRNIGSILTLAFVGTVISAVGIGVLTYIYATYISPIVGYTLSEAMIFGSVISATDPVTVLSIFSSLKVDHDLNALVFGESVFNDAVAIVLYKSILTYTTYNFTTDPELDVWMLVQTITEFIYIFIGSFCIGLAISWLNALLCKMTKIGMFPLLETVLMILLSYSTFLLAEVSNWSGIVAVLVCGISQKYYTYNNVSPSTALRLAQFFELYIFIADTFIFSYIGLSVFLFSNHIWDFGFLFWSYMSTQIARAASIYPLCFLLNLRRKPKIPWSHQHAITWSGLRGAMAFALAIRNTASPIRQLILTATLFCVIMSVLIQGGLTYPIIKFLKIKMGDKQEVESEHEERRYAWMSMLSNKDEVDLSRTPITSNALETQRVVQSNRSFLDSQMVNHNKQFQIEQDNVYHQTNRLTEAIKSFDEKFLRPFFTVNK